MHTKDPRAGRRTHLLATLAFAAFIGLALFLRTGAERPDPPSLTTPSTAVGSTPAVSARAADAAPAPAEAANAARPSAQPPPQQPASPRTEAPTAPAAPAAAPTPPAPAVDPPPGEAVKTSAKLRFSLDKDGISGAVREARPAMVECYEGWLKVHPALAGKVVVVFEIEAQRDDQDDQDDQGEPVGRVAKASLDHSELDHPFMEGCVLSAFSEMEFEAPTEGPLKVRYPLTFNRGD